MSTHTTPTTDALAEALRTLRVLLNKAHTVGQDDYREGASDSSVKRHYDEMRAAETNHRTALFALAQHAAAKRSAHLDAPHICFEHIEPAKERTAPVQGYVAGIPWSMHLRAYDAYCEKWGPQPELIRGWCRGGFGVSELDEFIPGWREELSEIHRLKAALRAAKAEPASSGATNHYVATVTPINGGMGPNWDEVRLRTGHVLQISEEGITVWPNEAAYQSADNENILAGVSFDFPASSGAQSEDSARLTKLDRMITEDCGYEITLRWDNSQDVMSISDHHGNVWGEAYPPDESEDEEGMGLALRAAIDSIRDHRPIRAARAAQGKGGVE